MIHRRGGDNLPAVLLLHPWWGVTDAMWWWTDQLVAAGHRVVMPDRYDGRIATTEEDAEAFQDALDMAEVRAVIAQCADELAAEWKPWAVVGFSMGAFQACPLAARGKASPDDLVLFYSGRPPGEGEIGTKRVSLHCAPDDEFFTDEEVADTEKAFAGADVTVFTYEGAGHWFAEPGAPNFDAAATELALGRVLEQLAQR